MKELKKLLKVEFEENEHTYTGYVPEEKLQSWSDVVDIVPWEDFAEEHGLGPEDTDGEFWVDGRLMMEEDFDDKGNVRVLKSGFRTVRPTDSVSDFATDTIYIQVTESVKNQWIYPYADAYNTVSEPTHFFVDETSEKIFLVEW